MALLELCSSKASVNSRLQPGWDDAVAPRVYHDASRVLVLPATTEGCARARGQVVLQVAHVESDTVGAARRSLVCFESLCVLV